MSESNDIPLVKDPPSQLDTGSYRNPIPGVDNWQPPIALLRPETDSSLPNSYFQDLVPTISWQCSCPLCLNSAQQFMVALKDTGRLYSANIETTGPIYGSLIASIMQSTNDETSATNVEVVPTEAASVAEGSETTAPGATSVDNGVAVGVGDTLTITVDHGDNADGNHITSGLMGGAGYPGSPPYVYYYPSMYYPQNPYMNMRLSEPTPYFSGSYYWDPSLSFAENSLNVGITDQNSVPPRSDSGVSDTTNINVNNDNDHSPNENGNNEDNASTTEATSDVVRNELEPEAETIQQSNGNGNSDSEISV